VTEIIDRIIWSLSVNEKVSHY